MKPSHGLIVILLVVTLVAGVGAYLLGRRDGGLNAEAAAALQQARVVLEATAPYQDAINALAAQLDSAAVRESQLNETVTRYRGSLAALRVSQRTHTLPADTGEVAGLARDLALSPTADGRWATDSIGVRSLSRLAWRSEVLLPQVEAFAASLDSLVSETRIKASLWEERAGLAETRVVVLEAALGDLVEARTCRFVFWNCPSRTTVFVVGGVLGLAGGLVAGSF